MITPKQITAIDKLNDRYYQVLSLLSRGFDYRETGTLMDISPSFVANIRSIIYDRIDAENGVHASTILTRWKRWHVNERRKAGIMF